MKATIESTTVHAEIEGIATRLWRGTTERGAPFMLYSWALSVEEGDHAEFDEAFLKRPPPAGAVQTITPTLIGAVPSPVSVESIMADCSVFMREVLTAVSARIVQRALELEGAGDHTEIRRHAYRRIVADFASRLANTPITDRDSCLLERIEPVSVNPWRPCCSSCHSENLNEADEGWRCAQCGEVWHGAEKRPDGSVT